MDTCFDSSEAVPIWDFMFRIIVLGDADVGKSCMVRAFTEGTFKAIDSTVGVDFAFKVIPLSSADCTVKLQIWDTAGGERFRAITHSYYRNSAGVVITFDVTSRQSFENIPQWVEQVKVYTGNPHVAVLLVGTKVDLSSIRVVTSEEALSMAQHFKMQYVEVSAKEMINVNRTFNLLASAIYHKLSSGQIVANSDNVGVTLNSYLTNSANHNAQSSATWFTGVNHHRLCLNDSSQSSHCCAGSGLSSSRTGHKSFEKKQVSKPI